MNPAQIQNELQTLHFAILKAIQDFEKKTGVKVSKVEYEPGVR
jgi:hypothetical protein